VQADAWAHLTVGKRVLSERSDSDFPSDRVLPYHSV
jgi:hypothetical protein